MVFNVKVWFESVKSMAQVLLLSNENQELLQIILDIRIGDIFTLQYTLVDN